MDPEIIDKVGQYIDERKLFRPGTPLLVAVSGGLDSMVAIDIMHQLNFPLGIAHCNFQLRGEASLKDQEFVKSKAAEKGLPFFTVDLDTKGYASTHKVSIQVAARLQRYEWLDEIRRDNGFHFVITAHHQKDNAETVLYNIIKNTGLRGMHGILPKRDQVARPLLCLSRDDIHSYAKDNRVEFREDVTNTDVKYSRNFLRLKVLPELEQLNPKAIEAIDALSRKVEEAEVLMDERLAQIKRKILITNQYSQELKFNYLLKHPSGRTILYEVLKDFGYNEEQCDGIYTSLCNQPGIEFLSKTHRVLKDRNSLYITPLESVRETILRFEKIPKQIVFNDYKIQVRKAPVHKMTLKPGNNYAYLDFDKISLPLTIRYWKSGDYFYPYGLSKDHSDKPGKKKLSKYFKDEKVPVHKKELNPVLFAGDHLVWLVGHRIDHRFRVTERTKNVLKMKITDQEA